MTAYPFSFMPDEFAGRLPVPNLRRHSRLPCRRPGFRKRLKVCPIAH
jgi:hypothetical protein